MDRVALVTGANRGIGLEVGRQLAKLGIAVLLSGRNLDKVQLAVADLAAEGLTVEPLELDVTKVEQIVRAVEAIGNDHGRLDILVNNAAVYLDESRSVFEISADAFDLTLDINLMGPLGLSQQLLPLLKKSPGGRVVNVSSGMGALQDMGSHDAAYRISKTSLNALTRIMASELNTTNIKVNAVCPGWVRTDMGGPNATRSVEQGAAGIIWAATLPEDGPTGGFYRDGERLDW